jgi:hypothetical protein
MSIGLSSSKIDHPDVDCTTVYGVSGTEAPWWDNIETTRLGWRMAHLAPGQSLSARVICTFDARIPFDR